MPEGSCTEAERLSLGRDWFVISDAWSKESLMPPSNVSWDMLSYQLARYFLNVNLTCTVHILFLPNIVASMDPLATRVLSSAGLLRIIEQRISTSKSIIWEGRSDELVCVLLRCGWWHRWLMIVESCLGALFTSCQWLITVESQHCLQMTHCCGKSVFFTHI